MCVHKMEIVKGGGGGGVEKREIGNRQFCILLTMTPGDTCFGFLSIHYILELLPHFLIRECMDSNLPLSFCTRLLNYA